MPCTDEKHEESILFDEALRMKPVSRSIYISKHKNRPVTHTIRIKAPERISSSQATLRPTSQSTVSNKLAQSMTDRVISTLGKSYGNYGPAITRENVLIQQLYDIKHKDRPLTRAFSVQAFNKKNYKLIDNPFFDCHNIKEITRLAEQRNFKKKLNMYLQADYEDQDDVEYVKMKRFTSLLDQINERLSQLQYHESECVSENDSEWFLSKLSGFSSNLDLLDRQNLCRQHTIDSMILRKSYKTNEALIGLQKNKLERQLKGDANVVAGAVEQRLSDFRRHLIVALAEGK